MLPVPGCVVHAEGGFVLPALAPDVARVLCSLIEDYDKLSLRRACRGFRDAASICFREAVVTARSPALRNDLLDVFPEVRRLHMVSESVSVADNELGCIVEMVQAASPRLLGLVTTLSMEIKLWDGKTMQELATRCTSLETLKLLTPFHHATFTGAGPTPAARRAHLQRQLASPAPTPALLHPSSWAARDCLTHLLLDLTGDLFSRHHPQATATLVQPHFPLVIPSPATLLVDLLWPLPHLAALTRLEVLVDDDIRFDLDAVLDVLPQLPQLLHLELVGDGGHVVGEAELQAGHLAPLTRLTHLTLSACFADTPNLRPLTNLRHLAMNPWEGDLADLFPMTSLTYLAFGSMFGGFADDEYDPDSVAALTIAVPGAWCTGLRHLRWLNSGHVDPAAMRLLTALTGLDLGHQAVTSELVGALAKLPHLQHLAFEHMQPQQGWHLAPPPLAQRPLLPSLKQVCLHGYDVAMLNALTCLTRLPPGNQDNLEVVVRRDTREEVHPVVQLQHWSPGWLPAMLRSMYLFGQLVQKKDLRLLFLCHEDVESFCAAAASALATARSRSSSGGAITTVGTTSSSGGCGGRSKIAVPLKLHIAPQLPGAALQQLASAANELCRDAALLGWALPSHSHVWDAAVDLRYAGVPPMPALQFVKLGPHQLHELPPGSLVNLLGACVDCHEVDAAALRVLLPAAPHLHQLELLNSTRWPVTSLLVLLEHPNLMALSFRDLPDARLGAAAIGALLQAAPRGFEVVLLWRRFQMYEDIAGAMLLSLDAACEPRPVKITFVPLREVRIEVRVL